MRARQTIMACCVLTAFGLSVLAFAGAIETSDATQGAELPLAADAPPRPVPPTTTVFAVGDVMLSRDVGSKIRWRKDVGYPYEATRDLISAADIAFANLETPITAGKPVPTNSMSFRADPDTVIGLSDAGFDVVSLANNHTPNAGQNGLRDTFDYLIAAGVMYAGAGRDDIDAHRPALLERNGVRFAFLAYNDADVVPASYFAGEERYGTAKMDVDRMAADVELARAVADVVIVSMHSGTEYKFEPNSRQTSFARAAIDAGADLILGHHAHVVQRAEWYDGKLILYGLGNFIFDQMWSMPTRYGLGAQLYFEGTHLKDVTLHPVLIHDYAQPRPVGGSEAVGIIKLLQLPYVERDGIYHLEMPAAEVAQ